MPPRHFDLGRYGTAINAVAVAWVAFLDVLYCFPIALPVTPENMSYVSVVCAGLLGFVTILWFTTKRGVFKGPHIDYDLLKERRLTAMREEADIVEGVPDRKLSVTANSSDQKDTVEMG